jgi:hypothetical protein
MNQKEQIRKELNEYLDTKIPRTEIDIYKHVVDFIKKDRKQQLILNGVSHRRELLIAFGEDWNTKNDTDQVEITEDDIDDYLAINCG